MKHDTVVAKYLSRYAEQEARLLEPGGGVWDHVLCVPACREADSLMHTLDSIAAARGSESALVIVVVNAREHASSAVHESNRQTLAALQRSGGVGSEPMAWGQLNGVGLLVIDRATDGRWLPPKQGVGLARKIAGDVALSLICRGVVRSRWIRCTDADVQVPVDFFERLSGLPKRTSAVIFPFEHTQEGCARQRQAMGVYDTYLQRYVDGLKAAGSPYAYHSIGSLIAVDARSYAVVRGIPKRMAAEDFYVLNKLAKVGTIHSLDGEPIRIRGRLSDRVPFGTGPALAEIMGALESGSPVRAYDPRVFEGVGDWLAALGRFVEAPDPVRLRAEIAAIAPPMGPALVQTLEKLGAFEAAEKASQQVSGAQLHRRLMEWNDAFRTLKLVHGLRDLGIC